MARITPDPKNANRGTQRGRGLLERSLREYGAGRSVLADRNGVLIAGNKTHEVATELGLPVRVIETDGHELVVVQRTDLDLATDKAAVELGIADNRVGETSLEWDVDVLAELAADDIDLSKFWHEWEFDALLGKTGDVNDPNAEWVGMPEYKQDDQNAAYKCIVNFKSEEDMRAFERLVEQRIPLNTKSIWYPAQDRMNLRGTAYVTQDSTDGT